MPSAGTARQRTTARSRKLPPAVTKPADETWNWPDEPSPAGAWGSSSNDDWIGAPIGQASSGIAVVSAAESDPIGDLCSAVEEEDLVTFKKALSAAQYLNLSLSKPLALVCKLGQHENLRLLLDAGASPAVEIYTMMKQRRADPATDVTEDSPLMLAVRYTLLEDGRGSQCVKLLIDANAMLEYQEMIVAVNTLCECLCIREEDLVLPLPGAEDALAGDAPVIKMLVSARADPNICSDICPGGELATMTPLMAACHGLRSICVRHLLDNRANPAFSLEHADIEDATNAGKDL